MKIITFAVNNFRSINGGLDNNKITFEGSNTIFIFGQNNVGKSSFLKAYQYFIDKNNAVAPENGDYYNQNKDLQIEFEIVVEIEDKDVQKIGESNLSGYNSFILSKNEENQIRVKKFWGGNKWNYQTYNFPTTDWVDGQSFGLGTVFGSVLPKPIFIKAMPNETDVKTTLNEILKLKAERKLKTEEQQKLNEARAIIKNLQDQIYGLESIKNYQDRVNQEFQSMFPQLSFEIKDTDKFKPTADKIGRDFDIYCKNSKNELVDDEGNKMYNLPESLLSNGHGTVRSAIFTFLMLQDEVEKEVETVDKDILILFEEPELFLHPKLTKQLRELMYKISAVGTEFQVLCASHSPQMIDISKDHTSLVRMVQNQNNSTQLYQFVKDLVDFKNPETEEPMSMGDKKQSIKEILRFNPYLCESFYADEVVLVEGDTEAIIWRAYIEEFGSNNKDIFIVNCGSCTNMPFYQKIFSKFHIKYSVICDTDHIKYAEDKTTVVSLDRNGWNMSIDSPSFRSHIQKSIEDQFKIDSQTGVALIFQVFEETFEPAHKAQSLPDKFKYEGYTAEEGKPFGANKYWEKIVQFKDEPEFKTIPIIKCIETILNS